jgi:hypothetical protein
MTELTSDPYDPGAQRPPGIRLTGWKEIAAYLDKAVRTVQRWERDFDLPVQRVSDDRVSSVYAFSADLDDWLRSPNAARARGQHSSEADDEGADFQNERGAPEVDLPPPGTRAARALPPRGKWQIPVITWVLAAAVLALAGAWAWQTWRPVSPPKPATWSVEGDTLTVFDSANRILFTHGFGTTLNASLYAPGARDGENYSGTDDLDGDGQYEFWFVSSPVRPTADSAREVYVFDHDGTVRWRYRYTGSVTFGTERFDPPWTAHFVFATNRPEGGAGRALWVSSVERTSFPSVLQRLDVGTGRPLSSYWSNGYITSVALGTLGGRKVLFVGGAFNDGKCSSLAALDATNPNGSAPAARDKYRCSDCPPGSPLAFVLFPKPARFTSPDTSGSIISIDATTADDVVVKVGHAFAAENYAVVIYRLDGLLRPTWFDAADGYLRPYEALARQKGLSLPTTETIDPATEFPPLLYWTGGSTFTPAAK